MSAEFTPVDEVAWQKKWADASLFDADIDTSRPSFYCLEMYPYPSGKMHMGHVRNYSIGDAVARFKRLMGFDVLYPMGFDSFGMPAENAAISEGGHPHDITERNMASITEQIKRMGFSYDWRRTLKSHDPRYYKWNQWFFTKFMESGLAVREHSPVNWCESCSTVLANEQVKAGRCWRCNGPVSQKEMNQWFLDLPSYCQELHDGLDSIKFPEHVKALQRDWLGRSEGANIVFEIADADQTIEVYTTRPDTLFGATFVTLAPEHPLAESLVAGSEYEPAWRDLRDRTAKMAEFDRIKNNNRKEGVFSGRYALHPLTGERLPIWFGNFVIATYGTGAVMAVPAHDERDFDFARMYDIPIQRVLVMKEDADADAEMKKAEVDLGWMVNSPLPGFDGLFGQEAKDAVCDALESAGSGNRTVNWKIRPWLISRQRYWGTPIPVIHCDACGAVPVPEHDLPVELPRDVVFGQGNPLETSASFVNASCPECGKDARRETDTMDTFMDSSWYFLRYTDALNDDEPFSQAVADHWMQVDFYCGGIEHAQMHLIYARFMTKALRDLGLTTANEPFYELLCQGMVNKSAPFCSACGVTLSTQFEGQPCPHCEGELGSRSAKMSKSLGNTVSPEEMVDRFGADTVRLFILFAANPTAGMDWSDTALEANHRVMLQLQGMPDQLASWKDEPTAMDGWMMARFNQRVHEFIDAMEQFDLRRAVEISHYDIIKDVNWYVRRGGGFSGVANRILPHWTQMISVSTPHLAEVWWERLPETEGFVSGSELDVPQRPSEVEALVLSGEHYIRDILDQARKVQNVAERHLGGPASKATFVISPDWKRTLAKAALTHVREGGHPKQFLPILQSLPMAQGERKGEIIGFWGKKMLPQVFKWDDLSREMVLSALDEATVLEDAKTFIADELNLDHVSIVVAETDADDTGRAHSAMPLSPAVVYG